MKKTTSRENVDAYIGGFSSEAKSRLTKLRDLIRKKVPEAEEGISYGMPAYKLQGKPLVYFAGYKNHISFYSMPTSYHKFAAKLVKYKQGKGSVKFPLGEALPLELIKKLSISDAKKIYKKQKHI